MAMWNPKPASVTIFVFSLLLLHKINSESFSFSFDFFEPGLPVALVGDAISYGGAILLTRRDQVGGEVVIRKNSVGRAVYFTPIHLWDRYTGNVADFTTEFTFVVDSGGPLLHGDGLVFFISPVESALHIPVNSSGGYLGLFNPENAFNPNRRNRVVAVELDSFGNEWDPVQESLAAHVGIDVNSLRSVKTADWPINSVPRGSLGKARISYDSKTKELSVTIIYDGTKQGRVVSLSQIVDLKSVLPEWVRIGFSAATGDLVESHDILSWSFSSSLRQEKST